MNIKFHNGENLEGNIILELLEEDYLPQVDRAVRKYCAKVDLKGFRKGQVPYEIVKKMYGPAILSQTVMEVAQQTLHEQLSNQELDLWGNPLMTESPLYDSTIDLNHPGTLTFKFEYGLIPPIDFKQLEEIKVNKYTITHPSEATINESIKKAQSRYATYQEVPRSEAGDLVYGILTKEASDKKNIYLPAETKIGSTGNNIDFLGLQPEDKLTLHFGPDQSYLVPTDDYEHEEILETLKSLNGEYQFTVEKVHRSIPAELDSDFFFEVLGSEKALTIESFKEELRNIHIKHAQMAADSMFFNTLEQTIVRELPFDIPENFLKKQLSATHPEWEENTVELFFKYLHPRLRWILIVDKFVEENQLGVTVAEINTIINPAFKNNSLDEGDISNEEALNKKVEKRFLKGDAASSHKEAYDRILHKKALDALSEKVNIQTQEKTVEEFYQMLEELHQKSDAAPLSTED